MNLVYLRKQWYCNFKVHYQPREDRFLDSGFYRVFHSLGLASYMSVFPVLQVWYRPDWGQAHRAYLPGQPRYSWVHVQEWTHCQITNASGTLSLERTQLHNTYCGREYLLLLRTLRKWQLAGTLYSEKSPRRKQKQRPGRSQCFSPRSACPGQRRPQHLSQPGEKDIVMSLKFILFSRK